MQRLQVILITLGSMAVSAALAQDGTTMKLSINRGRYVPELYGAALGKYMPDDSGKYRHMHVPYDGGYGDRGLKYINDLRDILRRPPEELLLGPKDHLRFMIDFNYNASGWQILHFEWLRDGDDDKQYHYKNENQLWQNTVEPNEVSYGAAANENNNINYLYNYEQPHEAGLADGEETTAQQPVDDYDIAATESPSSTDQTSNANVHVQGEYKDQTYNVAYQGNQQTQQQPNVRQSIKEVLDYIQKYILPTL